MYYQRKEYKIGIRSLIAFLLTVFLFDGLVRFIADFLGLYILNAWKDLLIVLFILFAIALIWIVTRKFYLTLWDILFLTLMVYSIPVGIADHGIIQTVWGVKIFFLPVIFYIFLFNLTPVIKDDTLVNRFLVAVMVLSIPIIFFGIIQYLTHFLVFKAVAPVTLGKLSFIKISYISKSVRAIGTFRSPFAFGDFSSWIVIFSMGFLLKSKKISTKFIFFLLIILGFLGVYTSTSRTSMLVAVYGITALLILKYLRAYPLQMRSILLLITVFFPFLILVVAIFGLGKHGGKLFFLLSTESIFARLLVWYDAIIQYPFFKNPLSFLFGFGAGAIGTAQRQVGSKFYNPVDNIFLYLLINFGVVGLFTFLSLILTPVMQFIRKIKDFEFGWFDIVAVLTLAILFVEGMYRTFFEGFPLPYIFWFLHFLFRYRLRNDLH